MAYLTSLDHEIGLLSRLAGSEPTQDQPISTELLSLPVDSVYLGGGTPTLAGNAGLTRLFAALRAHFEFEGGPEVTIEMTPGSADRQLLDSCRRLGINRLSIGAQSFDDRELRSVGRLHTGAETIEQVRLARSAGFENVSLDLIAGLPHQIEDAWQRSVRQALDLAPEHLSIYLFEIDEKSRLGNEVLLHGDRYHAEAVPSEDFVADAYERARESLRDAGYVQYEISNFARPGFESLHNRKYWRLGPYLGLGAGAHSFDGRARWSNLVSPEDYGARLAQDKLPVAEWRAIRHEEQLEEFFFLGLRQQEGIDLGSAASRWGPDVLEAWHERIDSLVTQGLLDRQGRQLRLAPHAYLISNEVFEQFVA